MQNKIKIGIIGGSGLEDPKFISEFKSKKVKTPFGEPSSNLIIGKIQQTSVVILSRHGTGHSISPTKINNQANIWALNNEKCSHILAITACGSLREAIEPGDFVFPDQFIDRTTKRANTFFEGADVKHTPMGEPFDKNMRTILSDSCNKLGFNYHQGGTVITIEGPRFSTKAESRMFQSWGADIINMSTVPEIILSRELNIHYQSIAMSTDYDCWRESEEEVSMDMIYAVMKKNVNDVKKLIMHSVPLIR